MGRQEIVSPVAMKTIFFTVFYFILSLSVTSNQAGAEVAGASDSMDEQNLSKVEFRIACGCVMSEDQERSLFIDYRNGVLFNLLKEKQVCMRFDLVNDTWGDNFTVGKIDLFGEVKIIQDDRFQDGKERRYSMRKVIYAPRAMRLKGVSSARFEQFGVTFNPGFVEYLVDGNHDDFALFVEAAEYNAGMRECNPLIFQLDPTHLFLRLSGVPVQKKDTTGVTELSFSFEKEEVLRELLPQSCSRAQISHYQGMKKLE